MRDAIYTTSEVAVIMVETAVTKHHTFWPKVFLKAVVSGVYLSFGGMLSIVLAGGSPGLTASNPGLVSVLSGFVFPVGLVMIILQGQELITSNMMFFSMAVLKRSIPWWGLPLNWFIVFFGNLGGSLFFAAVLAKGSGLLLHEPYVTYLHNFVIHKAVAPNWLQIYLRGIGCNWLVCTAVWQGAGARDGISKIVGIWFPIWVFVACSFDHVVANMFSLPLGMMLGADLTVSEYIKKSMFASLFGNITGALCIALPAVWFYLGEYHHNHALPTPATATTAEEKRSNGSTSS